MRRLLAFLVLSLPVWGQSSANILDPLRSINWTTAGITGQTPGTLPSDAWTKSGSTIATCGSVGTPVSATTCGIVAALSGCGTNHYVLLANGDFYLNTGIGIPTNCELRGGGANNTKIHFSGHNSYYWGQYFIGFIGTYDQTSDNGAAPGFGGCAGNCTKISWTGTAGSSGVYTKGGTVIDLAATATGLSAGMMLQLVQNDDTALANSYPACSSTGIHCSREGGDANGTAERQNVKVVSVAGTGASTQVTVTPGLFNDNWRTGQTPIAYYQACCTVSNAGVKDLTVDGSGDHSQVSEPTSFFMANDDWESGVVHLAYNNSGAGDRTETTLRLTRNITIQNGWFDTGFGGGTGSTTTYCIELVGSTSFLILNSIFHNCESPIIYSDGDEAGVVGYNYVIHCDPAVCVNGETGIDEHEVGAYYNLLEGNNASKIRSDDFHGTHAFTTIFRNYTTGSGEAAIDQDALNHFGNAVANVLVPVSPSNYQVAAPTTCATCGRFHTNVFRFGYPGGIDGSTACTSDGGAGAVACDSAVVTDYLRWGNYDSSRGAISWCGNSSDTGWVSVCGSASEIPTGIATYSNPLPTLGDTGAGQGALPNSFFLAATTAPSCGTGIAFWKTPATPNCEPFPPVGPDVSGATISGSGGHANPIPAVDCYNFVSGTVGTFNAGTCYAADSAATVATPTFSPVAGTYTGTQSVTISDATAGATICSTTDGSTPTANGAGTCTHGSTNASPITVSASETINAIGSKSGLADSSVGSAAYVINAPSNIHLVSGGTTINGGTQLK